MAIVDLAYYKTVYLGQEATDCDFPALEARAEDVIGVMTRWEATADTIADLPPFQRTLVKKAVCAQIDYFAVNGLDSIAGNTDGPGFTVGKVSISGKKIRLKFSNEFSQGPVTINGAQVAIAATAGLMNPAVSVVKGGHMAGWC